MLYFCSCPPLTLQHSSAVVCCRVTPLQKARMVRMVKVGGGGMAFLVICYYYYLFFFCVCGGSRCGFVFGRFMKICLREFTGETQNEVK